MSSLHLFYLQCTLMRYLIQLLDNLTKTEHPGNSTANKYVLFFDSAGKNKTLCINSDDLAHTHCLLTSYSTIVWHVESKFFYFWRNILSSIRMYQNLTLPLLFGQQCEKINILEFICRGPNSYYSF